MAEGSGGELWRRMLVLALFCVCAGWDGRTSAQDSSARPSPPTPPARAGSEAQLMERLRKMEEMNQKLLNQMEKLTKDNEALSKRLDDLSKRADGSSQGGGETSKRADDSSQGGGEKPSEGVAPSGIANQPRVDFNQGRQRTEEEGPQVGARASGARLLPEAQDVGYRRLGKIPLKGFYDYARDGIGFSTSDDEFLFKIRTQLQADYLIYPGLGSSSDVAHSGFYLPRVRYYFQGHYTKPIDYQLSFQRSYTTFGFLNVFLNFNYDPRLQLRVGRMKVPYSYEWYKLNNYRLITPERSLFNVNFGLNRMVGLMGLGQLFKDRLEYAVGIFDGPRNSFQDYNAGKDVSAFLNYMPFYQTSTFLKYLNVGGSVDYGQQNNPLQPAVLRTNVNASSETLSGTDPINNATLPFLAFNTNVREKGTREQWGLHLAYYYEGLSLIGAWDTGIEGYATPGHSPVRLPVTGYYIEAAYLVTGETLNERTVVDPIRRFDLRKGRFGLGAFEPYFRFSDLSVGNQVFTQGLADPNLWTNHVQLLDVGVNWYINRAVRIYFDWERAFFSQPVFFTPGPGLQKTNDLFWIRAQLYF